MPDTFRSRALRYASRSKFNSREKLRDGTERAGDGGEKHRNGARSLMAQRREEVILINIYLIKSLRVKGIVAVPRGRYLCRAVRG